MSELPLSKIKDNLTSALDLIRRITETEEVIADLSRDPMSLKLQAVVSGYNSDTDDDGKPLWPAKRLDLGDEHLAFVIQHLRLRVVDLENKLKGIGQFL